MNLETIIEEDNGEKVFVIDKIQISQNDSVHIREINREQFLLKNYGISKSYDLQMRSSSDNGFSIFSHNGITLVNNSSHKIVPVWNDLQNEPVIVLIDLGNDGTIDDTLSLENQVTGIDDDQGSLLNPNSYNLAQNYSNPFNPTTSIRYSIPQRSGVTIKVYDILGNEVATLVNEEKDRGVYTAIFNATGLSSGIYFYRLQSANFVQTKKMLILK
ncbi:MAG: T9SS type A sorting domain-containing protein [Ignavibacteriaceae bacterium]